MQIHPDQWFLSDDYLYGIDLYNFSFSWECHEVFEALWHAAGRNTAQGHFFQALIQLAAANLKRAQGNFPASRNLLRRGIARLQVVPGSYMGIDVADLTQAVLAHLEGRDPQAPCIRLNPSS